MVDITAVDNEAITQHERFFAREQNRVTAGINGILGTFLSPKYPSLGIARRGIVT